MNNKDRYQRSFNTLHLSEDFREKCRNPEESGKGKIMNFRAMYGISKLAAAAVLAGTIALGSAGVCYANDIGGIRTRIGMWINGEKQEVEIQQTGDSSYAIYDENGEETMGFGGVSIDAFGNEISMSAEELVGLMNNECHLTFTEDGRLIFTYKNLVEDVTNQTDKKGNLYIHVSDPSNPNTYFDITDIQEDGGYSTYAHSKPTFGKSYYEADSSDLVTEDAAMERDDDISVSVQAVGD